MEEKPLNDEELDAMELQFYRGGFSQAEMLRVLTSCKVQRKVLKKLFGFWKKELMRRVSTTDPVPNSELTYLKELVALEDEPLRPL